MVIYGLADLLVQFIETLLINMLKYGTGGSQVAVGDIDGGIGLRAGGTAEDVVGSPGPKTGASRIGIIFGPLRFLLSRKLVGQNSPRFYFIVAG